MNVLDNRINTVLAEAGLSMSERKVYLASGVNQARTSADLISITKMPRPTVLAALKMLRTFGLCHVQRRDGRSFTYVMQPAANLKTYVGGRARELDRLMDRLDSVPNLLEGHILTKEANGQDELQDLLELALRCKSRQWHIIAPHDNALRFMPKSYTDYFKKIRKEREIQSQTLWESGRKNQNLALRDVLMRKPRYVPGDVAKEIPSILLAFDDSLLVIDGTDNPMAVLVQSESVSKTFQLIFEMAWRSVRGA